MGVALGTCFIESDGKCYNQVRFYDKKGRFLDIQTYKRAHAADMRKKSKKEKGQK